MNNFSEKLANYNISISDDQISIFNMYYKELIKYNSIVDLTNIVDEEEVFDKHFLDSLILLNYLPQGQFNLLDIGAGAGFPSVPLKIMNDNIKLTIVDALQKRIEFLKNFTQLINVECNLIHSRIEDFKLKGEFDVVTARAVAPLNVLLEYALPFVKTNGFFIAMKGPNVKEEIAISENALFCLGGEISKVDKIKMPYGERTIVVVKKVLDIVGYPRKPKEIKKKPL